MKIVNHKMMLFKHLRFLNDMREMPKSFPRWLDSLIETFSEQYSLRH